jgi:NADH-quinone oxidoreductase subunit M
MRVLLPTLLVLPVLAAIVVAALGPRRGKAIRWISLGTALLGLLLAALLAVDFVRLRQAKNGAGELEPARASVPPTFEPELKTRFNLLHLRGLYEDAAKTKPTVIRFFVGIDGLNIWLIVLTAVLMLSAVLISWTAIQVRVNEYYAWLLALGTAMTGVFAAFDIILFYVFFELTLVPLFFLIGIWGGPQRQYAARKFFIYTLAGSLITLLGVLGIALAAYSKTGELTFSIPDLVAAVNQRLSLPADNSQGAAEQAFWSNVQVWVFLALMAGFAIKVPLVPFHTWLPLAHVEAPTAGSVLLAGILLKIGAYGFLRLCLPLTPDASLSIGVPLIGTLAVIGVIYGALCALAQGTPKGDFKKLVAYSSVSHLGMCMLGMFALNETGLAGSLLQMVNHGLSTGALFLLVGMLYERYHTRRIGDYGGMAARLKVLSACMVFICLTSVGLPGLNGFVGEVLVFMGLYDLKGASVSGLSLAVLASSGVVLGAWYLFTLLLRVFFGPVKEPLVHEEPGHGLHGDINGRELAALAPIAVLCVIIGVYPGPMLDAAKSDLRVVATLADKARERAQTQRVADVSPLMAAETPGSNAPGSPNEAEERP